MSNANVKSATYCYYTYEVQKEEEKLVHFAQNHMDWMDEMQQKSWF